MEIGIIIITLLFSSLFSGIEIAYISANKLRIELAGKKGSIAGRILSRLNDYPSYFIGTMLIGNNIALVIYGIYMAKILEVPIRQLFPAPLNQDFFILLVQTLVSTALVLIVGEFIPKLIFRIKANEVLRIFALPMTVLFLLFLPFVALVIFLSKVIIRLVFRIKVKETKPAFTRVDLESFVKEQHSSEEDEHNIDPKLFRRALYLANIKVKECMVPRPEIVALDVESSLEELTQKFIESKVSRIVIYEGSIDNIIGYVHHHDLLKNPKSIRSILFDMPVIPETMPASEVLNLFIKEHNTIAEVVDEYGATAGIVTMEDLLEEIFGEIEDEHDREDYLEKKISDKEYIFSARLEIDYLNEKYHLNLPTGDYETLGGLIVAHLNSIPKSRENIRIGSYEFLVLYATETKIESVKLIIRPEES